MRRPLVSTPRALIAFALAAAVLSGCGKSGAPSVAGGGPLRHLAPIEAQGAVSLTTRNTARVGGADTTVDAAAVARVVYPGITAGSRPETVVLVDSRNWPAALAASELAAAPLGAPLLYTASAELPAVSLHALEAMKPTGVQTLSGDPVIEVATTAQLPSPYRGRAQSVPAAPGPAMAAALEGVLARVQGATPNTAIIVDLRAPKALQMPAAGLAAESGAPILYTEGQALPPATVSALQSMHKPSIYVVDSSALSAISLGQLARLGSKVTSVSQSTTGEASATAGSIAVARFTDGTFGWGVKEPGHGLVFASSSRPLDAPASALLSATGDYGPLLLMEAPSTIPAALSSYLDDIQPAYSSAPEFSADKGVYNHGWLIGDERAISLTAQAELDSLLEISERKQGDAEETSAVTPE